MDPERSSSFKDVKTNLSQDLFESVLTIGLYSLAGLAFLFLFHLSAARYLGSEQYSVLGVFASILFSIVLVSSSIYLIITRFITYHQTRYQYEQINYLVTSSLKYFFAFGFLLFLVIFMFSSQIAEFFNITNPGPVVMLGFAIWLQLLVPIYEGAFKGLDNMHAMGRLRMVEALSRLCILLVLAYFSLQVTAMVFALGAGTFVALAISYVPIKRLQRLHMVKPNMTEIWEYAKPALLMTATIAIMLNLDLIVVKHVFPPNEAGIYAVASWLAKIPFILSWVLTGVLFPRVTKLFVDGKPTSHLLRTSLKWMALTVLASTLVNVFFANRIISYLFHTTIESSYYTGWYAASMGLLAFVNVLAVYQLALKRFTLANIIPWFVLAELVLFIIFHASVLEIVLITVIVTTLLVATIIYVLRHELQLEYMFNE